MKSKTKGVSFQSQLLMALCGISLILAVFYYQRNIRLQNKILETNFIRNNTLIAKTVKLGLEVGLKSDNFQAVNDVFDYAKEQKDLSWIIITDGEKEVFAHYPENLNLNKAWKQADIRQFDVDVSKSYITEDDYKTPLTSGRLIISFDTAAYHKVKENLKSDSLILTGGILTIALFISFIISKFLINSLLLLQSTIKKISEGSFNEKIMSHSKTIEIQELTHSFNSMMDQINHERNKSEKLLLNILPPPIANRLKKNETNIAMSNPSASILFADLVGYTDFSKNKKPEEVVFLLNEIFSQFDNETTHLGLEKIKTIGDSYMVAGGLFSPDDQAKSIYHLAHRLHDLLKDINQKFDSEFKVRIGIHTGPVVAGVIGKVKFSFDIWGNTVNFASRLESNGIAGRTQISEEFKNSLESLGVLLEGLNENHFEAKGLGKTIAYII